MAARVKKLTEDAFLRQVIGLAWLQGWLVHHQRPARTRKGWRTAIQGDPGFPDLVLLRSPRLIFAELKVGRRRPTLRQAEWLDFLRAAGCEVYLWRPSDWDTIERLLARGGS